MKRSVNLEQAEIYDAIREYVEKKAGFKAGSVRLTHTRGDRPFDPDYWTASVSEAE